MLPDALTLRHAAFFVQNTDPFLHVVLETADVLVADVVVHDAWPVHHAVRKCSHVAGSVFELHRPHALDIVVVEIADVGFVLLREEVLAISLEGALDKIALVEAAVLHVETALACFVAEVEIAFVLEDVGVLPLFVTNAVLQVVEPLSFVNAVVGAVLVDAEPVELVIFERPDVDTLVRKNHGALAIDASHGDLSSVDRPVLEYDLSQGRYLRPVLGKPEAAVLDRQVDGVDLDGLLLGNPDYFSVDLQLDDVSVFARFKQQFVFHFWVKAFVCGPRSGSKRRLTCHRGDEPTLHQAVLGDDHPDDALNRDDLLPGDLDLLAVESVANHF